MEDYVKAIFNNSSTSRQPSNRTQVKNFYFKMENMLGYFSASFDHEIKWSPKTNHTMSLMKKCNIPFSTFQYHLFSFLESVV